MSRKRAGARPAAVLGVLALTMGALTLQPPAAQASGTAWVLPLTVDGNRIADSSTNGPNGTGVTVTLNGIHRDGPEVNPPRFPSDDEITWMTTGHVPDPIQHTNGSWNANVVRIPLGAPLWLGNCSFYTATTQYHDAVDAVVASITSHGAVALLDLHTVAPNCTDLHPHSLPDPPAVTFWQQVSQRYASNPLVAYELYNEPRDVTDDAWLNGTRGAKTQTDCALPAWDANPAIRQSNQLQYQACLSNPATAKWVGVGMQDLYNAVAPYAQGHLVFVDGKDWGNNPPAVPVSTGTGPKVAYAMHAYACAKAGDTCDTTSSAKARQDLIGGWSTFEASHPVVMTEAGWPVYASSTSTTYIEGTGYYAETIACLHQRPVTWGFIGFAFDGQTHGAYDMVTNTQTYTPNTTSQPLYDLMTANAVGTCPPPPSP